MSLTQNTGHTAAATAHLLHQFKDKPKILALLTIFTELVQDVEDALWDVYVQRSIDVATYHTLDVLGTIVNQARNGLSDADYRRYIKARIATNRSAGVPEDLIIIARLILNNVAARVVLDPQGTAAVVLRVEDASVTDDEATILNTFLQQAKGAGVRLLLETSTNVTQAFRFDVGPGFLEYAEFDCADHTLGCTTVLYQLDGGPTDLQMRFVADGAGTGSFTVAGSWITFHYQSGVTTTANFEAHVIADVVVNGTIGLLTLGAAYTLVAGDAFALAPFTTNYDGGGEFASVLS